MRGGTSSGVSLGDVIYLDTSGVWKPAKADAVSTSNGLLGMYIGNVLTEGVLLRGMISLNGFTGNTGQPAYISAAAGGALVNARPTTTGHVVRLVGYQLDGTSGLTDIFHFNPDQSWIEL